jgi:hypothetical protein
VALVTVYATGKIPSRSQDRRQNNILDCTKKSHGAEGTDQHKGVFFFVMENNEGSPVLGSNIRGGGK